MSIPRQRYIFNNFSKLTQCLVHTTRSMSAAPKKIFVGRPLIKPALDILKNAGLDVKVWESETLMTEDDWVANVRGMHGLYSFGPQRITKRIIEAAGEQLHTFSVMAVGVDAIDIAELKKRGIRLGHTPDVLTDAVADVTIGLVLCTGRRLMEMSQKAMAGQWKSWEPFANLGVGLMDSTVGIVGLGRIGLAVAKRLIPFGVSKIVYSSRTEKEDASQVNATYVPLHELLAQSDFVICCCSMNETSKELFSYQEFAKMKPNAIFVNIGRGGMVNQDALLDALQTNKIRAAGLDVTTPEPLPPDHPLFKCSNCVILPHIGSAEEGTRTRMAVLAAKNLVAGLKGEKMPAEYPL